MPRRARQLVPPGVPRRGELIAACAVVILLVHLLFALLTLVLAVTFAVTGKITRWRPCWLVAPAVAGLAWMLAAGPGEALTGFAAGPLSVLRHLAGTPGAGHAARPLAAFAGIGGWLPRQLPVALPLAAAEAALAGWLAWLHTDEWAVPPPRPGAVAALRSAFAARLIRAGAVLTRHGVALGIAPSTGAVAELTWQEASRGVLVTGADARQVTLTCLQLVHAAVRRRKPVIVLDDGHDGGIARALAAACQATGTPLRRDGGSPAQGRSVASRGGQGAPETMAEPSGAPLPPGDSGAPRAPDTMAQPSGATRGVEYSNLGPLDWIKLSGDGKIGALVRGVAPPGDNSGASQLWGRAAGPGDMGPGAAGTHGAGPGVAVREGQAREPAGPDLDLGLVVSERSAAVVSVQAPESAARAAQRLTALGATLRRIGVDGDGLIWVPSAERLPAQVLAALVSDGAAAGLPVLAGAVSPATAGQVAELVGALLVHRLTDRGLADGLAARAGTRLLPVAIAAARADQFRSASIGQSAQFATPSVGQSAEQQAVLTPCPVIEPRALLSLRPAEFVLVATVPRRRVVASGRLVPARLPRPRELPQRERRWGGRA